MGVVCCLSFFCVISPTPSSAHLVGVLHIAFLYYALDIIWFALLAVVFSVLSFCFRAAQPVCRIGEVPPISVFFRLPTFDVQKHPRIDSYRVSFLL